MQNNAVKLYRSKSDHLYMWAVYVFTLTASLVILVPLIFVLAASFSSPEALLSARVYLWPVEFNLRGYKMIIEHDMLITGFRNTFLYASLGSLINIVMTILAAYPLSRKDLKVRNGVMFLFAFTMLFNGGLIPTYLLVKDLRMINTIWAMMIPNAMAVWNVIITRTYFQSTSPASCWRAPASTAATISSSCSRSPSRCPRPSSPSTSCSTRWATGTAFSTP